MRLATRLSWRASLQICRIRWQKSIRHKLFWTEVRKKSSKSSCFGCRPKSVTRKLLPSSWVSFWVNLQESVKNDRAGRGLETTAVRKWWSSKIFLSFCKSVLHLLPLVRVGAREEGACLHLCWGVVGSTRILQGFCHRFFRALVASLGLEELWILPLPQHKRSWSKRYGAGQVELNYKKSKELCGLKVDCADIMMKMCSPESERGNAKKVLKKVVVFSKKLCQKEGRSTNNSWHKKHRRLKITPSLKIEINQAISML